MKKNYKTIFIVFLIPIVFVSFLFIGGYRFTAMQAVKSSLNPDKVVNVFGEVKRDGGTVYLLEMQSGIKTAFTEKKGLLWSCESSTYFFDDIIKNDAVKTVGWISIKYKNNKQVTVFAVQNKDPDVRFIEAGTNSDRQRKPISLNETVIFSWDNALPWNDMNAIAFNKDNLQSYKYEYLKNVTTISTKDLRWYPINNEK